METEARRQESCKAHRGLRRGTHLRGPGERGGGGTLLSRHNSELRPLVCLWLEGEPWPTTRPASSTWLLPFRGRAWPLLCFPCSGNSRFSFSF